MAAIVQAEWWVVNTDVLLSTTHAAGGIGFSLGSHLVNEDAGTVTACIDVRINLNAPGQFMIMVITATDGSAQLGE